MNLDLKKIKYCDDGRFMDRLKSIFADMDRGYSRAVEHYDFDCNGCQDICCQTRFYHHTYIEYLLIKAGFKTLSSDMQSEIVSKASKVVSQTIDLEKEAKPVRLMCPLNFEALCVVYPYRPMICRLHGIPHEFQNGAGHRVQGPGCETFDRRCSEIQYIKFDRTPFYREVAALEKEFRQTVGINAKIRMTIAEIIHSIAQSA
jgi:Fe-S-cluster containining protein